MILIDILDGFVRCIKEKPDFLDVRFIHSGKTTPAEKPVKSFLVACSVGKTQRVMSTLGYEESAELEFTVYAPQNSGRRELSELSNKLYLSLEECNTENLITELRVASAMYDSEMCTQYQRVTAVVKRAEYLQEEIPEEPPEQEPEDEPAERDIALKINDGNVSGIIAFEEKYTSEYYPVKEFLGGITGKVLPLGGEKILEIKSSVPLYILEDNTVSVISIENMQTNRFYGDCKLKKSQHSLNNLGEVVYVYTLEAGLRVYDEGSDN